MDWSEKLDKLEATLGQQNVVGRELLHIYRAAMRGAVVEAASRLEAVTQACSELERSQNVRLMLGTSFAARRLDLVGSLLAKQFCPQCEVLIGSTTAISRFYIILFEKIRMNYIKLTFSKYLEPSLIHFDAQVDLLLHIMPLFAEAAMSDKVGSGACFSNQWDAGIVPGLSFSAAGDDFFLIPDPEFLSRRGYREQKQAAAMAGTPWAQRTGIAFWRGATTGQRLRTAGGWRSLQRVDLCETSRAHPEYVDAGFSKIVQMSAEEAEEIRSSGLMKDWFASSDLHRYKYQIDIDGNSNAWASLFEKLLTGSPVLKIASPKGYRQWYYDRLRPWHNYVPVSGDLSDLVEKIKWLQSHDDAAQVIGENGRLLAHSIEYKSEIAGAVQTLGAAFRAFSAVRADMLSEHPSIRTHHGTLMAYDTGARRLVHVIAELFAVNPKLIRLHVTQTGEATYLQTDDMRYIVGIDEDGSAGLARKAGTGPNDSFSMERKEANEEAPFSLTMCGRYACADNQNLLTISREHASIWELFVATKMPAV